MDISQWLIMFQVISESALVEHSLSPNVNSVLFALYFILSLLIKRATYLVAFFMSCLLFDAAIFDALTESQLYLLTFAIYSYVIFVIPCNVKATFACGILITLSIVLAYDAYFYSLGGAYGASETFIYRHIDSLALYAHVIFICALAPYRRIKDGFRRGASAFVRMSRNSACFVVM